MGSQPPASFPRNLSAHTLTEDAFAGEHLAAETCSRIDLPLVPAIIMFGSMQGMVRMP